ncbi:MAG: glycosyltransferase [bacterium]
MQVRFSQEMDNRAVTERELDTRHQDAYRVSAVVSVYKSTRFLGGLFEDLLAQTLYQRGELEIVVVDSASPENDWDIIKRYADNYLHIRAIRTSDRESLYQAWNRGIVESRGRYITNANTDDRHHPEALETIANALDQHPDISLIYSDQYVSSVFNETFEQNSRVKLLRPADYFAPSLLLAYPFGPQPMWRREVHDEIGLFDGSYKATGDFDFAIRFARKFKAMHLSQPLGLYYVGDSAISFRDDTMAVENGRIVSTWYNRDTILELYRIEGVALTSAEQRAAALLDFGLRALEFYSSWNYGKAQRKIHLALECFQLAAEEAPGWVPSLNNAALTIALEGGIDEAVKLLEMAFGVTREETLRRNVQILQSARKGNSFVSDIRWMPSGLSLPSEPELFHVDVPRITAAQQVNPLLQADAAPFTHTGRDDRS